MNPIADYIGNLQLGNEQVYKNMAVVPLHGEASGLEYLVMQDAMSKGLHIEETTDVQSLYIVNGTGSDVLFIPGECVTGGKQDRMMSATGYIGADFKGRVPVKCVEAGRWAFSGPQGPGGRRRDGAEETDESRRDGEPAHPGGILGHLYDGNRHYAKGEPETRFCASGRIASPTLRASADQQEAWSSISSLHATLNVKSPTSNFMELHSQRREQISEYMQNFSFPEGANGFIVVQDIGGERHFGLELFDSPGTCTHYFSSLLESYCVESLRGGEDITPQRLAIEPFFTNVKEAATSEQSAIDKGTYLQVRSTDVKGNLLHREGIPLYMSVIDTNQRDRGQGRSPGGFPGDAGGGLHYGGFFRRGGDANLVIGYRPQPGPLNRPDSWFSGPSDGSYRF